MLADVPRGRGLLVQPRSASALADAVATLVPMGPSGVEERQSRGQMLISQPVTFDELFCEALDA